MKKLKILLLFLIVYCFNGLITPTYAVSVLPQAPFSEEGNPDEAYQFNEIFPLYRYIRVPALEIYENKDIDRSYVDVDVCEVGDYRDYQCSVDAATGATIDGCEGGPVDVCYKDNGTVTSQVAFTKDSSPNNSCSAKKIPGGSGVVTGKCSYITRPSNNKDVKGTDFSSNDILTFAKIQSGSGAYMNWGTENPITWGSSYLQLNQGDLIINKLLVLRRAKQTKATFSQTGEWPLGWVDWGYKDKNMSKTLLEMYDQLPDSVAAAVMGIAEGMDDFFLTGGSLTAMSDISGAKEAAIRTVSLELGKKEPEQWALDLTTVPVYAPSWRQGFIRPSICVFRVCCPTLRCPIETIGTKRGLYYDTSISQVFGGALDNLFINYSLDEAVKIFKNVASTNPLVRFATSADIPAIPSEIRKRLDNELKSDCLKYIPWSNWLAFGTHIDYVNPGDFLDPAKKCPDYNVIGDVTKENANAFNTFTPVAALTLMWGEKVDEVADIRRHLITIPDAMAQSIQELQQPTYDTRDTLAELESVKKINEKKSNTIDDSEDYLIGGQSTIPASHARTLGLYACNDSMFSAQLSTSIQAYALGTRIGCTQSTTAGTGKCNGQKFAELLASSKWKTPLGTATQIVKNSAMFEGSVMNPKLEAVYAKAEEETGVPCEVLAGLHFEEATTAFTSTRDPETKSVQNGGAASRDGGFEASAIAAAKTLLRHPITNTERLITAISNYNGGGNSNCQSGFPALIPYGGCPRQFIGEDDPYATNLLDGRHTNMYLLYCGDFLPCIPPKVYGNDRPGAFTAALVVYNEYTSKNTPSSATTPSTSSTTSTPGTITTGNGLNPAGDCGTGYIDTALGCLPYERTEFVMALLRLLTGIAGLIALSVMLFATIQIMTASGDSKKLQSGRDLFSSALAGLLFLIFSVSILRLVGFNILKIPGF